MSSLPEPQEGVRALSPLCLSHPPDLPFTHLAEILSLTSIAGLGSCDVCLLMIPIVFNSAARGVPWSSKSGRLPLMAVSTKLQCHRLVCAGDGGWGDGSSPKLKCHRPGWPYLGSLVTQLLTVPSEVLPPSYIFNVFFISIYSLIAFHLV